MIMDKHFSNMTKAMTGLAYTYPAYFSHSTDTASILTTDTSMSGEIHSRFISSNTAYPAMADYSAIASGTAVLVSTGEVIKMLGAFSASTSGDMHVKISIPSITQTTNFDINWIIDIGYTRL